ncbi:MAG: ABC transporter permease, partial [Clostridiales bacterium]|nr:ABC transporter permease [Clostridiales bacterium]
AMKSYSVGEKITWRGKEFTVSGIALHPLYCNRIEEASFVCEDESLDYLIFVTEDAFPIVNDVYITLSDRNLFNGFSKEYKAKIDGLKSELLAEFENIEVLTLYENFGVYSSVEYAHKVGYIAIIFVVFFLLITILVVYSNMSRLLDEERGQIACLKTLGRGDFPIIARYLLFVLVGTVLGALAALPIGMGLTYIIYVAFDSQYFMPPWPGASHLVYYLITFAIILVSMLLLTLFTAMKTVRNKPVTLLAHKAPKAGRKVIVEHIGFIWNKLAFKYKSTLRNVVLFRSRFYMTVISIIGSTVLVLAGFGLMDCAMKIANSESILAIAVVLIIFSGLLCALVIYNLTNINVSERKREIATLMVLGYNDREVTGYIFREVYIMCFIGAVFGVPLGVAFLKFVFGLIDFGTLADINWWTYLIAPAVTMLFSFLSTLLIRRTILKTDMNASLKTLE